MSIALAISIYAAIVTSVSSMVIYYFKVIRPKDESQWGP